MPETPFTGLIRSLRAASSPWERLRLIGSGAKTLGALPQRQRRALIRNLGLAGAEDLVDRLAEGDEEALRGFRRALERLEEDPEDLRRLVSHLKDPKTRKDTLMGLFSHLEKAVEEKLDEETEEGGDGGIEGRPGDDAEGGAEEEGEGETPEPAEAGLAAEGSPSGPGEAPEGRGEPGPPAEDPPHEVRSSPEEASREETAERRPGPGPAPAPDRSPAPSAEPVDSPGPARLRSERSEKVDPEIPEKELHAVEPPEGSSGPPSRKRGAAFRTAPPPSRARGRRTPSESTPPPRPSRRDPTTPPGASPSVPRRTSIRSEAPRAPETARGTDLVSDLRRFREDLDRTEPSSDSLRDRLEELPSGWPRRRALEAAIRAGAVPGLDATIRLVSSVLAPRDRIWCLAALAETLVQTDEDWKHLLEAAPDPASRRRLRLRRSAAGS